MAEPETPRPVAPPLYAPPPPPRFVAPVSFRNPIALRTALFVGIAGGLISDILPLIAWLAAGFFAVFFYRRKTHDRLNLAAGMRLGWITGLIMCTMQGITIAILGLNGALTKQIESAMESPAFQYR